MGGINNIITFADDEAKTICLNSWDSDNNGYFMKNEAEVVTESALHGKFVNKWNLTSFDEFEHFTGIYDLRWYNANGFGTFTNTALTKLTLPNTITLIQDKSITGCSDLSRIKVLSINPPTLEGVTMFDSMSSDLVIYVPDESIDAYKTANNWSLLADKIKPLSECVE